MEVFMNLYICGSNRKHNSYNFLKAIKNEEDILCSLSDLNIKYCMGCNACAKNEDNHCVLKDDMKEIYDNIEKCENIIIMSPIYMNYITGILKNVIDRFNPYCASEKLRGKKIYLITVGQMSEEDQENVVAKIDEYFESLSEFLYFDFEYLYNFTSGDVLEIDDINKMYNDTQLNNIINSIKEKIKE
jgi:multimeric flavodoxin WrbA